MEIEMTNTNYRTFKFILFFVLSLWAGIIIGFFIFAKFQPLFSNTSENHISNITSEENSSLMVNTDTFPADYVPFDLTGLYKDIEWLAWLAPRYYTSEELSFSPEALPTSTTWVLLTQPPVSSESGTSIIGHGNYLIYKNGPDACLGIQSYDNKNLLSFYQLTGYGNWLQTEIEMLLQLTTGI